MYLRQATNLMAFGGTLLAFVAALALGTAGAPAIGRFSWVMVTAGAAGLVVVASCAVGSALADGHRLLVRVTAPGAGGRPRSRGR